MSSFGEGAQNQMMKIINFSVEIIIKSKVLPAMVSQFSTEQRIFITLEYSKKMGTRGFFQKYNCVIFWIYFSAFLRTYSSDLFKILDFMHICRKWDNQKNDVLYCMQNLAIHPSLTHPVYKKLYWINPN